MNFLAHLRLAGDDPQCVVGNFLGDFVKGRIDDRYPLRIRCGIEMHRKIDAWTDSHQKVRNCARLISPARKRWSMVIVDILYDYLLTVNWNRYSQESLDQFLERMNSIILPALESFSEHVPKMARRIIEDGWIEKYRSISGLEEAFNALSVRVGRENTLAGAEKELANCYDQMNENFNLFFPEAIAYADSLRVSLLGGYE